MAEVRFLPSLFDKLTSDVDPSRRRDEGTGSGEGERSAGPFRFYTVPRVDRYGASAARNVLRRDLGWLFNTISLDSTVDLSDTPEVQRSVLNYGVPDLTGKTTTRRVLEQRARELRTAIRSFEPRLSPDLLDVEVARTNERENSVTFVVRSHILSSVQPLPVEYKTDVEVDTGSASVRD